MQHELRNVLDRIGITERRAREELTIRLSEADIWYPDIGPDCIYYLRRRNVLDYLYTEPSKRPFYFKKHRQQIKPGKFLVKADIYTYNLGHQLSALLAPPEIIEISGDLLKWAYNVNSNAGNTGTLSSSCMRYAKMEPYMELYARNARMAILISSSQIIARALLWDEVKLEDKTFTFMDRIYGNPREVQQMKDYAVEKGYAHKVKQSYDYHPVMWNGKKLDMDRSKVILKSPYHISRPLPYLDTFPYGTYKDNHIIELTNIKVLQGPAIRTTNGGHGDRYCVKCGKIIHRSSGLCPECGIPADKRINRTCPICKELYTMGSYGEVHAPCIFKRKYKCKDCGINHIAQSQEEFDRKTCKEES